jgi:hypothetical protein
MEKEKTTDIQITIAKIISLVFHPLFMPLYGLVIIFSAPTLFWYLPFKVKKILFLVMMTNNVMIPVSLMPFFRYRNIISSWVIEKRNERVIPLFSVALLYSVTSIIMYRFQIPLFVKAYFFSTFFLVLAVLLINMWWKISIHSVGAGALTGIVFTLSVKMSTLLTWYLIPSVIVAGLVLSSRLKLSSHDSAQVYIGFITGLSGMTLFMLFF